MILEARVSHFRAAVPAQREWWTRVSRPAAHGCKKYDFGLLPLDSTPS